jgi:hypothetical protein
LTSEDEKKLSTYREWLQMKTRAFEAKKRKKVPDDEVVPDPAKRKWDEPSFFQELEARCGAGEVYTAREILKWARQRATRVWWGEGSRRGSFVPVFSYKGKDHQLFAVWTAGMVEIYFYWYRYKTPFDSEEKRQDLLSRLNAIETISLPDEAIAKRPNIHLSALGDDAVLKQFLAIFDWFIQEIRST